MNALRFFAPSVLALPAEARDLVGPAGALAMRAALSRVWTVGGATYRPVAVAAAVPGGVADLVARRRHTLEIGAVCVSGSPAAALERALGQVEALLADGAALAALLGEYNARATNAGLGAAKDVRQAFVLAPGEVYDAARAEVDRVREVRARVEPTALGFRFLACEEAGRELAIEAAPAPWGEELSMVRGVA